MWAEIWWSMSGGVKSEYDSLKKTDVQEFWRLFDLWQDKLEKQRELYRKQSTKNGK